jgi:GDPmannose 4,6-dehydratase
MTNIALITGITGQDGSYLTELLISKGYTVHGIVRRQSLDGLTLGAYIKAHERAPIFTHYGDLLNTEQITNLIYNVQPNEVYHLGAQSHVQVSFENPEHTGNVIALGTTRLLEAIRRSGLQDIRFFNAATSEMFGSTPPPQDECSKFQPRSPYACAKEYGYWMTRNYRNGYHLHTSSAISFNHESPRRGDNFVTRKITKAIARILAKKQTKLHLGDLSTQRDWGFAPEYVKVFWKVLQQDEPGDYVIGTGHTNSIKEFVDEAFTYADLNPSKHIEIDQQFVRPTDVAVLKADASKAKEVLGWSPKIHMKELARIMVDSDLRAIGMKPIGDGDDLIEKHFPKKWWWND